MGDVIHQPPREHHCRPGWKDEPLAADNHLREHGWTHQATMDPATWDAAPGTLWRCECGRVWVARRNAPGRLYAHWVPEPPLSGWLRRRRDKRAVRP